MGVQCQIYLHVMLGHSGMLRENQFNEEDSLIHRDQLIAEYNPDYILIEKDYYSATFLASIKAMGQSIIDDEELLLIKL